MWFLEILRGAIQKVSSLAPDATRNPPAVLDLFGATPTTIYRKPTYLPVPQPDFDNRTCHQKILDTAAPLPPGTSRTMKV